jgi:hypothetical protein
MSSEEKNKGIFHRFFVREVPKGDGMLSTETEEVPRKGRIGVTALLAVLAGLYGYDSAFNNSGIRDAVINAFQGGSPRIEQAVPMYSGEVDRATQDYFSLKSDGLTYIVGSEFDANSLEGQVVEVKGSRLSSNSDFVGASEIRVRGEEIPVYVKGEGVTYTDPTPEFDPLDYARVKNLSYNKKTGWEDTESDLITLTGRLADRAGEKIIQVLQDDQVAGQIRLQDTSDYMLFRLGELGNNPARFYLKKKATVEWATDGKTDRKTTKDLFYAAVDGFDLLPPPPIE